MISSNKINLKLKLSAKFTPTLYCSDFQGPHPGPDLDQMASTYRPSLYIKLGMQRHNAMMYMFTILKKIGYLNCEKF